MGADSNRAKLRYARETTWGETPASVNATELRYTSEGLAHNKQTVTSNTIRSDGQRDAVLEVFKSGQGPINFELAYADYEPFFETALRGTLVSTVTAGLATVAASSITGSAGVDYVGTASTGYEAGQWIRLRSTGYANQGVVVQIESLTSTVMTVRGTTLTASTLASANIIGRTLKNGNDKTSYFIETDFEDIANGVKYHTGARVDSGSLNIVSQQIVTGVFNFQTERGFAAASTLTVSTTSAGTNTPLTAAVNVGDVRENNAVVTNAIQAITLNFGRNMRPRPQVGQSTSAEHGDGGVDVSGNLTLYFEDKALYDKMIDHTLSSISVPLTDENSNTIIVTVPNLYYTAGDPLPPGIDQDVFLPLDFTAKRDSTTNATIRMDFLPVS